MESRSDGAAEGGGAAGEGSEDINYNYEQSASQHLRDHSDDNNAQLSGEHDDYEEDNTDMGAGREDLNTGIDRETTSSFPNPTTRDNDDSNEYNHNYSLDDPFQDTTPDVVDDPSEQHDAPNRTALEEDDMHHKLMDMESSFLPEPSTIGVGGAMGPGADDTYLMGAQEQVGEESEMQGNQQDDAADAAREDAFKTPVPTRSADVGVGGGGAQQHANTSALETLSSPPTTAAAARTVSRVLSESSSARFGSQRQDDRSGGGNTTTTTAQNPGARDPDATPVRTKSQNYGRLQEGDSNTESPHYTLPTYSSERRRRRPKFLNNRQSANRLSGSSSALTTNTDATSNDTTMGMGVDYALQTGGAAPENNSLGSQGGQGSRRDLTRSTSLGSMASGISSGMSDEAMLERHGFSGISDASLHTLEEEEDGASQLGQKAPDAEKEDEDQDDEDGAEDAPPATPKAKARDGPQDTITTQRFQDSAPSTALRQPFRESNLDLSPDKRGSITSAAGFSRGKHMTLKEQSSTIDRLSKENFDLKMRIHFLTEALSKRSEEGIQEMVSENVELKSDKLKLQKELQSLRKTMREMQKKLKERGTEEEEGRKGEAGYDSEKAAMDEEELIYLRERVEIYESEIEKLKSESVARESEKRKMAEMVKNMGEGRGSVGSETGAREERDMWKDMLDAETAAREQAEEESKRLRDELFRMKSGPDSARGESQQHGQAGSQVSHPASERNLDRSIRPSSSASKTLVELDLLKQENAELRREVSAQTSMLTSRNREKERLYQEIEDLKLGQHRSVAGDSILDRSASRAADGAGSRVSEGTRTSRLSESERETYENKTDELRDQVATLKLENQSMRAQLDEYAAELESIDRVYQEDMEKMDENMQTVQMEREHALRVVDEREAEFQDLKAEAQEELDVLNDQLDEKTDLHQRMEVELKNQEENLQALQDELRSASEGIFRLEEDAQNNLQRYKDVQNELDEAGSALEATEKSLFEANNKVQRLTVQQESSQNEIAFLREEQDGDKIKIGDLESELKGTNVSLQTEKEKAKELDQRLAEERYQREVVDSKEKQQVQKLMNELNREATASKEEVRKLKKSLSAREDEASTWKDRLMELENNLREALGDLNGTRSSMLMSITKLQKELESTSLELESMRNTLDEKEALLRNRDALLESHGLETRKLGDLLERERQAHRADKHSFEQSLKSHNQASRTINQNNSRITELENARSQDRKRFNNLEQQYKDQLNERNSMFLSLWKRLSAICGPDWAHSNSLINGNLPSQEVIGNVLFWPGFSKNLLLAMKTVESQMTGCKSRIKGVERDLTKEYQSLEQNLSARMKKLDRLEEAVVQIRSNRRPNNSSNTPGNTELSKLKGENRLLKAELNLQQSHTRARASGPSTASPGSRVDQHDNNNTNNNNNNNDGDNGGSGAAATALSRGLSTGSRPSGFSPAATPTPSTPTVTSPGDGQARKPSSSSDTGAVATQAPFYPPSHNMRTGSGSEPSQEKWTQRLRELEKRLKAEREARLLDRSGARKRLEERNAENKELRAELEREKLKSRNPPPLGDAINGSRRQRQLAIGGGDGQSDDRKTSSRRENRSSGSVARKTKTGQTQSRSQTRGGDQEDDNDGSGGMVVIPQSHEAAGDQHHGEDDYDTGTGTGTDDGEPLTVEVEM